MISKRPVRMTTQVPKWTDSEGFKLLEPMVPHELNIAVTRHRMSRKTPDLTQGRRRETPRDLLIAGCAGWSSRLMPWNFELRTPKLQSKRLNDMERILGLAYFSITKQFWYSFWKFFSDLLWAAKFVGCILRTSAKLYKSLLLKRHGGQQWHHTENLINTFGGRISNKARSEKLVPLAVKLSTGSSLEFTRLCTCCWIVFAGGHGSNPGLEETTTIAGHWPLRCYSVRRLNAILTIFILLIIANLIVIIVINH